MIRKALIVAVFLVLQVVGNPVAQATKTGDSLCPVKPFLISPYVERDCVGCRLPSVPVQALDYLENCDFDTTDPSCATAPLIDEMLSELLNIPPGGTRCQDCQDCQDPGCCCTWADCDCVWVWYCGTTVTLSCSYYGLWSGGWQNDENGVCRLHYMYCPWPGDIVSP